MAYITRKEEITKFIFPSWQKRFYERLLFFKKKKIKSRGKCQKYSTYCYSIVTFRALKGLSKIKFSSSFSKKRSASHFPKKKKKFCKNGESCEGELT